MRGKQLVQYVVQRHGLQKVFVPLNNELGELILAAPEKTQLSYCLSHFLQAKYRSLISGILGFILKIRKMYCYN